MPDHAGFAGAITVHEHVLRTALKSGYANGSDSGKKFVEDLSGDGLGVQPDLFLGEPDIDWEGATNLLVATLPMWGQVTITKNQVTHAVGVSGTMEMTLTPVFRTGPKGTPKQNSLVLDQIATVINARRWTATVTSTGQEFRRRFETTFRQGVVFGKISTPAGPGTSTAARGRRWISGSKGWRPTSTGRGG